MVYIIIEDSKIISAFDHENPDKRIKGKIRFNQEELAKKVGVRGKPLFSWKNE